MLESLVSLRGATPLVVCGLARSGTRFVANVLDRLDSVGVVGEVPELALKPNLEAKIKTLAYYEGLGNNRNWDAYYKDHLKLSIFFDWIVLSKKNNNRTLKKINSTEQGLSFFCVKTPYHEKCAGLYRDLLGERAVRYIFCYRKFEDHFVSMQAMNDRNTFSVVARKYLQTAKSYFELKMQQEKEVSLILTGDMRNVHKLNERVLRFLNLPVICEAELISVNKNASEQFGRVKKGISMEDDFNIKNMPILKKTYELIENVESGAVLPCEGSGVFNDLLRLEAGHFSI